MINKIASPRSSPPDGPPLPVEVTSFVGRAAELSAVRSRLADGARLVTLTGVGGVGKSRIAVRAAGQLVPSVADSVHYVDLAQLRHGELLVPAVLDSVGVDAASAEVMTESLVRGLLGRDLVLVLDNCDHLQSACAQLITLLLTRTTGVAVLATSRSPIDATGEWLVPVPPLVGADGGDGERDAVQLFVDRVRAVRPDFLAEPATITQVAALCRRLDGLPLAIELAARRMRVLSLAQLSVRLEDRFRVLTEAPQDAPERHRSLRAVLDLSYEQCSAGQRVLWARASVFVGGAGLEALEAVCSTGAEPGGGVLDLVDGLVQRSILMRDEASTGPRYRMLESVREYGRHRLGESTEAAELHRRHREHYAEMARSAEQDWFGPGQDQWCDRLRAELPNLRAALDSFLRTDDRPAAAAMVATLWPLWLAHGQLHEGRMWSHRAVGPDLTDARAKWVTAWIDLLEGDLDSAADQLVASVALAREHGDDATLAMALGLQGAVAAYTGDLEGAAQAHENALLINESTSDRAGRAMLLVQLGELYCTQGRLGDALRCARESRGLSEPVGELCCSSYAMWVDALALHIGGDNTAAEATARTALAAKRRLRDRVGILLVGELLAWIAVERGELERGALLLGATSGIWESVSSQLMGFHELTRHRDRAVARIRRQLGATVAEDIWQRGSHLSEQAMLDAALGMDPAAAEAQPESAPAGPSAGSDVLTRRELEVAELIAEGLTNRQIARRLVIGQRTAETHVANILSKAGLRRRGQVARWLAGPGRS